jgi:hypothetical protein
VWGGSASLHDVEWDVIVLGGGQGPAFDSVAVLEQGP